MKAKKPLLLVALACALLAVVLIVPAAASAKQGPDANPNQQVNWVVGNYNDDDPPDHHIGFTVDVRQSGPDLATLEGFVLQKIMYTSNPLFQDAPVVRRATEFAPENEEWVDLWSDAMGPFYLENYAVFCGDTDEFAWPWDIFGEPSNLPDPSDEADDANIVDFVIYLPADFLWPIVFPIFGWIDPEQLPEIVPDPNIVPFTTMPHRYVIVDFDDPGREDLVQIYGWLGIWYPQLGQPAPPPEGEPLLEPNWDLVSVPAGNFQVHVGGE